MIEGGVNKTKEICLKWVERAHARNPKIVAHFNRDLKILSTVREMAAESMELGLKTNGGTGKVKLL